MARRTIQSKLRRIMASIIILIAAVFAVLMFFLAGVSREIDRIILREFSLVRASQEVLVTTSGLHDIVERIHGIGSLESLPELRELTADFRRKTLDVNIILRAMELGSESAAFEMAHDGVLAQEWRESGFGERFTLAKPSPELAPDIERVSSILREFSAETLDSVLHHAKLLRLLEREGIESTSEIVLQAHGHGAPAAMEGMEMEDMGMVDAPMEHEEATATGEDAIIATASRMNRSLASALELQDSINEAVVALSRSSEGRVRDASRMIDDIFRSALPVSAGFVLIGLILLIVIVEALARRYVIGPVARLDAAARKVTGGELALSGVRTDDELGSFGEAFDRMVKEVWSVRGDLERRVEERTSDLEQEKNKFETFLNSMGDGAFVVDRERKLTFFNRTAEGLSGYRAEEALGRPYDDVLKFVKEDDDAVDRRFVEDAMSKGITTHMQKHSVLIRKGGSRIAVADSAAPILDERGNVVGCIVIFRDETRLRSIERAKSEFISISSHQLRTPLSSVRWYLEMLLDGDAGRLKKKQIDFLRDAYTSATRMTDLINGLLNTSRIDAGSLAVKPKEVDTRRLAKEASAELQPQIKEKGLRLSVKVAPEAASIMTDAKLLKEVLLNLLGNAVKYTPKKGDIRLEISKEGRRTRFVIGDTGYGIPQEEQGKVFEKFFRASNVVKKDTTGTGLGLYVVGRIVELLGGEISFDSELGKGTTFRFSLPMDGLKTRAGPKGLV